jgi:hypothetical protein
MGSKIFNRPHDLQLAEKLTDGCVVCPLSSDSTSNIVVGI